jgi:23S rRNA (adenine2503-C2)-methyltransferase
MLDHLPKADCKSVELCGLDRQELLSIVDERGEPGYRAQQIAEAVYRQRVHTVDEISTLPQQFRQKLAESGVVVGMPKIERQFVSHDGTVRYLIEFADGQSVETVWMPEGDGGEAGDGSEVGDVPSATEHVGTVAPGRPAERQLGGAVDSGMRADGRKRSSQDGRDWDRATICISSQVGCAVDCRFCLTALLGVKRNLTAGEIVGQVCAVLKDQKVAPPQDRINLVFMGMGEPFLNYDNFMKAVRLLVEEVGIAESRMTVSTAGIVPRIHDFGQEAVRPKLAISLNASNDEQRTQLMPLNRKWDLQQLIGAARDFPLRNRERITFEYVLLNGVNDAATHAREVVELLRGLRAKVNLIALNPGPGIDFSTPTGDRVAAFQQVLMQAGIPAFVRRPRGRDIYAACGQLKRTVEIAAAPES